MRLQRTMHDYYATLLAAGAVSSPTPVGKNTRKKMGKSVLQLGQMCPPDVCARKQEICIIGHRQFWCSTLKIGLPTVFTRRCGGESINCATGSTILLQLHVFGPHPQPLTHLSTPLHRITHFIHKKIDILIGGDRRLPFVFKYIYIKYIGLDIEIISNFI